MPIERDLTNKRFFITGATGFLGTALVERILRCIPEADITVVVRPGRRADAPARLARRGLGPDGLAALAASDIVIHSAATVSFDAPLTQAVEINLLGPARVAAAIAETGSAAPLDELVTAGTARALSLGWPDAYPFTKALGERALVEQWEGRVPITVVRPSIIESALSEPRAGWIRGFRTAEPIIVSYARGLLREFPGVPEGIVDVI